MRKRTKIGVGFLAGSLCVLMAGGAAYALTPSMEEAMQQEAQAEAQAESAFDEDMADSYISAAKLLDLTGKDANGALLNGGTGSPSLLAPEAVSVMKTPAAPADDQANSQAAAEADDALPPMSLLIFGNVIPFVDDYKAERAPDTTAALWMGQDSTTDGSWGYFIGHHPGVFNCVMYLQDGDQITVCDRDGNARTYTVFAVYDVPDDTEWGQISQEVTGHGESIALQTCCGDHESYRIVEAA